MEFYCNIVVEDQNLLAVNDKIFILDQEEVRSSIL